MQRFSNVATFFWNNPNITRFTIDTDSDQPYLDVHLPRLPLQLESISIWNAPNLWYLPELPSSIKSVELHDCALKELELPESLQRLILGGGLPSLKLKQLPAQLKWLMVKDTPNLADLLPPLPSTLERLDLTNNSAWLPQLPDSLKTLKLTHLQITELPARLPSSLEELEIDDCPNLRRLPDLPASLKKVRITNPRAYFKLGGTEVIMTQCA